MKTIIMESTLQWMAFLGMMAEIERILQNATEKQTKTGVTYFVIGDVGRS